MRKSFLLIVFTIFISCQNEEIKPRTNPQFSKALIQEIDESGVQFAANVYDYGSEEILEFGFVFDESSNPRLETGETVTEVGRPPSFFQLHAIHSMATGVKYHVAAYLRTESKVVYSTPVSFVSQGSIGFVFEGIEIPNPVYFGDKVTVYGKNLSRNPNGYEFYVQGEKGFIEEMGNDHFIARLPEIFHLRDSSQELEFEVRFFDKANKFKKEVNFRDPQFLDGVKYYNYSDHIYIRGEYLKARDVAVWYLDGEIRTPLEIVRFSDNEISFIPKAFFTSPFPELVINIRGKEYILKDKFSFNPTEIISGQKFYVAPGQSFEFQGQNVNPYFNGFHTLEADYSEVEFFPPWTNRKEFLQSWFPLRSNLPQKVTVKLKTFEQLSEESFEIYIMN